MSFPLLLQQQGVQLRSWHYRIKSTQLVCRTCLLGRRPLHLQHTTPTLLVADSTIGCTTGIQYRWSPLQQRQRLSTLGSSPLPQQRHVHIMATPKDSRVEKLISLLSRSPSSPGSSSSSTTHTIRRRNHRKKLSTLYESIRHDPLVWNQIDSHQLMALYKALRPSLNEPALNLLIINAQHVLEDIQKYTPNQFSMVHVEALLSTYKTHNRAEAAVDLIDWVTTTSPLATPSLQAYEYLIATLTTCGHQSIKDQSPMVLALQYWNQVKTLAATNNNTATSDLMVGYMMQGYLAQGDLLTASSWLTTHTDLSKNEKMAQVLDFWKTASAGDPYQYAVGVVSYGLEKLIQQAACNDRYYDARQFYRQQCGLYNNKKELSSTQQQQSAVGLIRLVDRCIATNQSSTLRQLLEDALEFGHEKGIKVMANRLGAYYLTKNRLRYAFDLYFHLDSLPALDNTSTMAQIVYDKNKTRSILLTAAKSKYHVDMYRLYQRFTTHYPSSLELRAYTHILQSLIRTKQYDHALVVYQDVLSQATRLLVSDGQAEHTKRLFHLVYSLCAQTGDADLFQSVVTLQRQVGFPNLPHHSLTSLMATYVKKGELTSAKAVFDHLAHQQQQQPQALTPSSITADQDHDHDGGDRPEEVEQSDVVDVVDFNLLMRIVGQEQVEFRKQGGEEPVANRILDILRHMALVGVQSNATTLRTLLDVYQEDGEMEDEMFTTLMNDPQATHHDHIWLNNLKLTRILLYGNDNNNGDLGDNAMEAAKVFLSNKRLHLFPTASPDEPILADGMTYKLLLDQLTKNHHTYMAQHIFDHMRSRGWRPPIAVYEQLVAAWARKGRLVKAKAAMAVACQDLGWTIAPTKWYTLVLDLLVQNKSNRVNAWVLEIKKTETLLLDPVLAKRFVTYGLDPFSISSSSSTCASKTPRQQHRKQSQQ